MRALAIALWLLPVSAGAEAQAQCIASPRGGYVQDMPVRWGTALQRAFGAFAQESNPNPECFTFFAREEGEGLRVTFVPGRRAPEDANLRGGETSCGREVSFLMSKDGEILRKRYAR